MSNIDTARLFIPHPTGYDLNISRYSVRPMGMNLQRYNAFKKVKNVDDTPCISDFYEIVSYFYSMDLSRVPTVRPFVQYYDYMLQNGAITGNDKIVIEHLKKNCCSLIIPDDDERDYIHHMYFNTLKRSVGGFMFDYDKTIPVRFQTIKDRGIEVLVNQIGMSARLR